MKKIFVFFTIFSIVLGSLPNSIMAQTATASAENISTQSAVVTTAENASQSANSLFNDQFVNSSVVPSNNFSGPDLSWVQPNFDTSGSQPLSSTIFNKSAKWAIASGTKHDLKGDEAYKVNINDISSQNISADVLDPKGNKVSVDLEKIDTVNGTNLTILPPKNFRPGKYTLKLTDSGGNVTTQDFTWGVLAINTNKSIFLPNETADIAMAVLDDTGNMVCDAQVSLSITSPDGQVTVLSTKNSKIIINSQCNLHNFSLIPDYETHYQAAGTGIYQMTLIADTKNGTRTINDSFQVQNAVPFDIERQTGTRIYPPNQYPVNLNIKINQDFKGQIIDYVPSSFQIFPATQGASFTVKDIAAPIASSTNTFGTFLNLGLPYKGNVLETLGFGQHILDPLEHDLYAKFKLSGHDGLDFEMPIGTPVYSTDDGTVVMAGGQIYGTTIVIQHNWGRSYYGHLSEVKVKMGQVITKGQEIGLSGNTGITTGPHLHFSIKLNANDPNNGYYGKTDPSSYLGLSNNQTVLGTSTISDTIKAIVWDVNVKKGDVLNLSYFFKTPNVSPYFYTIGPLSFLQNNQEIFKEVRQWQLANDVVFPATSYLSSTADTLLTGTTSWQIVTSAPASGNTTTNVNHSNKNAGYYQWKPGTANTTNFGTTAPTTPDGTGFLYETPLNSTIPTGTWQFTVQTNTSATVNSTEAPTVCVWSVSISGGAITSPVSIIPCTDGATSISTAGTTTQTISVSGVAAVSFTSSQYLYVEYWEHQSSAGSGKTVSTTITFQANAGVNNKIVTPGSSSNLAPNAPSQDSPLNSATGVSTTPTFLMTSTDAETNNLQYKVTIYSDACTTAVQTNDQSVSQTGWTGQNATCVSGSDCYTSGTQGSYTTQTALSNSTQYWWRASAKDPQGANTFTNSSTCNTFTTQASGPTLDQLLRHGEWFSSGVRQPFTF